MARICILNSYDDLSLTVATFVINKVMENFSCVLGLPTGETPVGTYKWLRSFAKNGVDFSGVTTFNLDEYIGLNADNPQSYRYFMQRELFSKVKFKANYLPNGMATSLKEECERYDELISLMGIDLQLLGIGSNGHIGFNEPSQFWSYGTSVVNLTKQTIQDNANKYWNGSTENVPTKALSMGSTQIMWANEILLIASGESKAKAVRDALEGPVSPICPASILRRHKNCTFIIDEAAAKFLSSETIKKCI